MKAADQSLSDLGGEGKHVKHEPTILSHQIPWLSERLAPRGTVMLVEPFAHDRTEDNLNVVGRLYYAASTTICCAHAISEGGRLVLGAQAGEARVAEVFRKAGCAHFRRAAETPFNSIFEVRH
jgi:hypothetical protein